MLPRGAADQRAAQAEMLVDHVGSTSVGCEPFLPALHRFHLQPAEPSPATTPTAFTSSSATHGLDTYVVDKDTGPW